MKQFKYSDNWYHRKCFLEREQVPTQSVMRNKMRALAPVYFKSMRYKLKVLAGLEPPMVGGGCDWFIPPDDLLNEGRVVLKPIDKKILFKLGYNGLDFLGQMIMKMHYSALAEERRLALQQNDDLWKARIKAACNAQWDDVSKEEGKKNTQMLLQAFQDFTMVYQTSITKIEMLLMDSARKELKKVRQGTHHRMCRLYEKLLKQQATEIYDRYTKLLDDKKAELRANFMFDVAEVHKEAGITVHDIQVEKHIAIEKLRHLLECKKAACQLYIALKEREECTKDMELSKHEHYKKIKLLKKQMTVTDTDLRQEIEKERKRQEFINVWKKKICHVVKRFQDFVGYCLHMLPEQAEFFVNMEKLMLLQLGDAIEEPDVESLFEPEASFHTPVPEPHPFYVFRNGRDKPDIDPALCPRHATSSASRLPVVVLNKRCIYSACDNYEKFTELVMAYIGGERGADSEVADDYSYGRAVPVRAPSWQRLDELKLESSLMRVLQQDMPNTKDVPIQCCFCKIPYCFCSPIRMSAISLPPVVEKKSSSLSSGEKLETREAQRAHEREPKWESYMEHVLPRKCACAKTAKKHLQEHLPPYMRSVSKYEEPELVNYRMCSARELRKLVRTARGRVTPPPVPPPPPAATRAVAVQYHDVEFDELCECYSEDEVAKLFERLVRGSRLFEPAQSVASRSRALTSAAGAVSPRLSQSPRSFATSRAWSLRTMVRDEPQLEELFRKEDCELISDVRTYIAGEKHK